MINEENLRGTIVLLHPEMWETQTGKQGVIGEIVSADLENDDFYVVYGNAEPQLHGADALLVLKDPDEIYEYLQNFARDISHHDFKDLKSIALLANYGTTKHVRTALELVQNNHKILEASVLPLDKLLGPQQNTGIKR